MLASVVFARVSPPPANSAKSVASIGLTLGWLDLGELPPSGRAVDIFMIHLRAKNPIWVARFETPCPCLQVSPSTLDLKPDETQVIAVEFNADEEPAFHGDLATQLEGHGWSRGKGDGAEARRPINPIPKNGKLFSPFSLV